MSQTKEARDPMPENLEKQKRTKEKMQNALIDLCSEGNYYDVTIGKICDRAGVYRSTFYRYFDSKDELLREIEDRYVEDTRELTRGIENFRADCSIEEFQAYREVLTKDMEYHLQHRKLCVFLLSPSGDPYFMKHMKESLTKSFELCLANNGVYLGKNKFYLSNYFASSFISTIHEWLKRGDESPKEISGFLIGMVIMYLK